jgi:SAM-dependent methyltransferase
MVSRAGNSTGVHLSSGQEDSVRSSVSKYYGEVNSLSCVHLGTVHLLFVLLTELCRKNKEYLFYNTRLCGTRPVRSFCNSQTLQASSDLRTSACCTAKPPSAEVRELLAKVPQDIVSRYYGCGSPFPVGLQHSGLRVLDLGCGTGRDCYICAALVGEEGSVTGE